MEGCCSVFWVMDGDCADGALVCRLCSATWFDCTWTQQLALSPFHTAKAASNVRSKHRGCVCAWRLTHVMCVLHLLLACRLPHALR